MKTNMMMTKKRKTRVAKNKVHGDNNYVPIVSAMANVAYFRKHVTWC